MKSRSSITTISRSIRTILHALGTLGSRVSSPIPLSWGRVATREGWQHPIQNSWKRVFRVQGLHVSLVCNLSSSLGTNPPVRVWSSQHPHSLRGSTNIPSPQSSFRIWHDLSTERTTDLVVLGRGCYTHTSHRGRAWTV